jgi:hypothetical protein
LYSHFFKLIALSDSSFSLTVLGVFSFKNFSNQDTFVSSVAFILRYFNLASNNFTLAVISFTNFSALESLYVVFLVSIQIFTSFFMVSASIVNAFLLFSVFVEYQVDKFFVKSTAFEDTRLL